MVEDSPMVLGIANRTENWKTARCLSPLFGDEAVRLARRLGEPRATRPEEVRLELYWKGARDYCAGEDKERRAERLVASCRRLFPCLREKIEGFDGFRDLKEHSYDVSSEDQRMRLLNNLLNTEIDIVLESPERLYIGEAKYKSGFHADGKLVLVHQLVRQYVIAKVLVDVLGCDRKVVPFVVVEGVTAGPGYSRTSGGPAERSKQVRFMVDQCWMDPRNRLTWDEVAALASERPGAGVRE